MGTSDPSVMFMIIILFQLMINYFSIITSTSRENRRPLTEVELQREAENIWENKTENDIVEDIVGGEDSDEDYVEKQLSDSDSEQSENEDEVVDEPVRNIPRLLGKNGHRWSTQPPASQGGVSENLWCGKDFTENELLEYALEVENNLMGGENSDASVQTKGGKELSMTTAEILDVEPATAEEAEWKAGSEDIKNLGAKIDYDQQNLEINDIKIPFFFELNPLNLKKFNQTTRNYINIPVDINEGQPQIKFNNVRIPESIAYAKNGLCTIPIPEARNEIEINFQQQIKVDPLSNFEIGNPKINNKNINIDEKENKYSSWKKCPCDQSMDTEETDECIVTDDDVIPREKPTTFRCSKKDDVFEDNSSEDIDFEELAKEQEKENQFVNFLEGKSSQYTNAKFQNVVKERRRFVVFSYEGQLYPREIVAFDEETVTIHAMQRSLKMCKWPSKRDELTYQWSDVLGCIKPPKQISKRGVFSVPEFTDCFD
ncbi:hypothetical protein RN001_009107 [Aquatica leii]|uniref:Uncharacterized protein n=1 Tax=Aquatica leii TaxID=1421715 RepID=A0AAN7S808_9COLE|nr:hypothetical protein RN001_009107 [Aquatica leii]